MPDKKKERREENFHKPLLSPSYRMRGFFYLKYFKKYLDNWNKCFIFEGKLEA